MRPRTLGVPAGNAAVVRASVTTGFVFIFGVAVLPDAAAFPLALCALCAFSVAASHAGY